MKTKFLWLVLLSVFFVSCKTAQKTVAHHSGDFHIKYLDQYTIPHGLKFKDTWVGGLSGIDYDTSSHQYYIISDERSATTPSRFYTATIHIDKNKIKSVDFTSVHSLQNRYGQFFPSIKENPVEAADPESIRYNPVKKNLVWTSEGDKAQRNGNMVIVNPSIYEMDLTGNYLDSFELAQNLLMKAGEAGPRTNGVFEGSAFDGDATHLYVSVEEPLFEDGARADVDNAGAPIRITKFDVAKRKPVAQYAYLLDAVARKPIPATAFRVNGVPEILWLSKDKLLVIERSFSTGYLKCAIKIFVADLAKATNVLEEASLKNATKYRPVQKKLVFNFDSIGGHIDNVEGVSFGPVLPNGHRSLLFIADNNFQWLQKSQVFLFEVLP